MSKYNENCCGNKPIYFSKDTIKKNKDKMIHAKRKQKKS